MKKLLISILGIFFGLFSFSNASFLCSNTPQSVQDLELGLNIPYTLTLSGYYSIQQQFFSTLVISDGVNTITSVSDDFGRNILLFFPSSTSVTFTCTDLELGGDTCWDYIEYLNDNIQDCNGLGGSSDITVYYNNGQTTSIACNGDNIITIDGLSSMSSISTFTPFFNINYTDQNNQVLTDSYSNSILYLSGGQYLKTYTGGSNNDWILNLISSEDTVFTGYLPIFDVTGNITEIDTGNVFNNFAENSLTVLLSNIPNYIQYVIMFTLLLFVLWIFRRLRK